MKITLILLFLSFSIFAQKNCESDTTINKYELLKLKSLNQECGEEVLRYINTINQLEKTLIASQKRLKFLEDMIIHRERYKIKNVQLSKRIKNENDLFNY
jgi:protease II